MINSSVEPGSLRTPGELRRTVSIGLIGFLTLVDLFATQAILPSLAAEYRVSPSQIGLAANASTLGMAVAALLAGGFGRSVQRRRGIWLSLALLAIPTALLAFAPDLATFAALRVVQGLLMATAFTLTLAYLAENCSAAAASSALAAYVTGGVASNLVGRLIAATTVEALGTSANFILFAVLNLAGAALVAATLSNTPTPMAVHTRGGHFWSALTGHLTDPALRAAFAIGFLILFGFIGTFSYVGFVLMQPPQALTMMALGLVFLVFAPSLLTTPLAGKAVAKFGTRTILPASLALALAGLPMLLGARLPMILLGLTLIAIGTFFAQATATGYVGRRADGERAAASGLYLASYYSGGLAGAAIVGRLFESAGWGAAVASVFAALSIAAFLGSRLQENPR